MRHKHPERPLNKQTELVSVDREKLSRVKFKIDWYFTPTLE